MPNVEELRERLGDQLQYAPDLKAYRKDARRILSDANEAIQLAHVWPWRRKKRALWVFPDVSIANANWSIAAGRAFSINAATVLSGKMYAAEDAAVGARFQEQLTQAELDLEDRSKRALGTGNWQDAPFAVVDATTGTGALTLYPDHRAGITAKTGAEGNLVLRWRRYLMPAECSEVLGIVDDDNRPLTAVTAANVRRLAVDRDATGQRPTHFFTDGGFDTRHQAQPSFENNGWDGRSEQQYETENEPIRSDPPFVATATNTAPNGLLASTEYRVIVCWYYGGRYGPPSKVVTVSTTSANKAIALTGLPAPPANYGRQLAFFLAEGEGAFYLTGYKDSATYDIASRVIDQTADYRTVRWDDVNPDGPYTYVRPWPRSDTYRRLEVEYVARPRQLLEDTDVPQLPKEFHLAVLHQAILLMGTRHEGESLKATHAALLNEVMGRLTARHAPQLRYVPQKGMIDLGGREFPRLTSVTWKGP